MYDDVGPKATGYTALDIPTVKTVSVNISRYLCLAGADFVHVVIVTTGKALVAEVHYSTRSRSIHRTCGKMTPLTGRHLVR